MVKSLSGLGKLLNLFNVKKIIYNALDLPMKFPPHGLTLQNEVFRSQDPLRYQFIALAITQLKKDCITGAFAEAGVFRGVTSKIIHRLAPERLLYLFDTFTGFPRHLQKNNDPRFNATRSEEH